MADETLFRRMWQAGDSIADIAAVFGMPAGSVYSKAERCNLLARPTDGEHRGIAGDPLLVRLHEKHPEQAR